MSTMSAPLEPSNSAVSHPSGTRFSFRWTINNFSDLSNTLHTKRENYPRFYSSAFPSTTSKPAARKFTLVIFPKGINANLRAYLSIGLELSRIGKDQHIPVRYQLSLVNSKTGCRHNIKEWFDIFSYSKEMSMFGRFIAKSELYDPSNGFVTDDKLVIHCEMTVLGVNAQMYLPPTMSKTEKMFAFIRDMTWDRPTTLDYVNANLKDLSDVAKSQPKTMTKMIRDLATSNNRLIKSNYINCNRNLFLRYHVGDIPDWAIHNQVDETLSYTFRKKICDDDHDEFVCWSPSNCPKSMPELKQLWRREMLNILNFWMVSGKYSDLSFVLGDQKKVLNVHKIVLLNQSPAFDVLLHEINQKRTYHRVSIGDASSDVFDQFIHYFYTGKVPLLKKYQHELLNFSMKYGLDVLKQMSALALFDQVTTETVLSMLTFAHSICAVELKQACLEYATDHATQLMNFDLHSLKPELIEEMFRNFALKNSILDCETAELLNKEILDYESYGKKHEPEFYTGGILKNELLGNKILRNRILKDETTRKHILPSIQHQDCVKFEETVTLTTRHYGENIFWNYIYEDKFDDYHRPGLPQFKIGRIPRVFSRENDRYDWHEFFSSFESSNVKTVMNEVNSSVTVHLRVSVRDIYAKPRYSTDKWIHVTRKSGLGKVRGFISDHILKNNRFEYISDAVPLTVDQYMSVYESVDVRAHTKYVHSIDQLKQMSLKQVLIDLRSPLDCETSNDSTSNALFGVLNLLSVYLYDFNDGGGQKSWETDLLVNIAKYGIDYVKSSFENVTVDQVSNENVVKLLYYSNLCAGFNRLHQVCLQFVIQNAFESMFTDYWNVIAKSRPELLVLMFSLLAKSKHCNSEVKKFNHVYETLLLKVSNRTDETFSYTHLSMHHIVYDWPIDSIISTLINLYSKLVSPKFCAPEKSTLKFRIAKLPSDKEDSNEKKFATNLVLKRDRSNGCFDKKTEDLIMCYKVSFEYAKETVTSRDYVQRLEIGSSYIHLANDLSLPIADLLDYYSENMLETNNKFNIRCEITLLCDIAAYDLTKPIKQLSKLVKSSRKRFCDWTNRLWKSDDKRDVTLVVSGTEFKVHSIFLAQSPVLEALIIQSNRINIHDLSIEAFEQLMQYLYTGKVQSLDKYAKELLIVASKYKLEILAEMCDLVLN